jgi:hypothetical protein
VRSGVDQGNAAALLLAVGLLLGVLAVAVPEAAGLKTKEASTTVEFNTAGSVAAKCKQGTKPISGGFLDAAFNPGPGSRLSPYSSQKLGRKWEAAGWNYGGGDATLVGYAYCDKETRVKARSKTVDVDGFEVATAAAKCKRGERVISGGFDDPTFDTAQPPDGSRVLTYVSRKLGGRKWEVSGYNNASGPGTLTAYVYCAKGTRVKERSSSIEVAGDTDQVVASCKRRERAVSGGFATELDPVLPGPYTLPYGSRKVGRRGWEVSGYSDSAVAGTVTAYVYCGKQQ